MHDSVFLLVECSSWSLSGLAMQPIYQSYQQQQFTANTAHELRSPLASLLATVEAITHIQDQENLPNMLPTVERQGRRLSRLIDDLLLLASIEQNGTNLQFQPCCLNDLISDLAEEFWELAIASNINLSSHTPKDTIYVLGDEPQLYRLVANLLTNAIQFTPAGGDVQICLERHERTALITVKDSGIGIPRKTGGTGLGLAIAKGIVQHHQGQLTVKSELGQGSLFRIQLRCHQVVAVSGSSHSKFT